MKIYQSLKNTLVDIICMLYILLFVYAAVNKLLDFNNFQVQLAQSPLLSSFASWISWVVPIVELSVALLFLSPKTRLIGLYASFSLMVMFSVYIVIILNFSPFIPCSCGGILDKLTWGQHLIFNIIFVIIAIPAILILSEKKQRICIIRYPILSMLFLMILSGSLVAILFVMSEDMIHHRNNFTRRFPHHPAEYVRDKKLESYSPYIAGSHNGKVYIGDTKDPLKIIEFSNDLKNSNIRKISTNEPDRLFRKLHVTINAPYFYLSDGLEAFTFRGKTTDWKATLWMEKLAYYNAFVPVDSSHAAIRSLSRDKNENMLGLISQGNPGTVIFNKGLLDKQIDGVFDTDGKLLYNDLHRRLIYVYTYRNEYLITDSKLQLKLLANTIDTISRARIKVEYVKSLKVNKIASPMRIVNKNAFTEKDFLYVNSKLIGQLEAADMWEEASIIDVYNILTKAYLFSFYLYDKEGKKISDFIVDNGKIYTLAGKTLTVYNLDPVPFEKNK